MTTRANIYPINVKNPTILYSDAARPNIGVCFSGGGSRAMTCAWGQLLGLKTLNLMDKVRYISSVSGGTWTSSIYSYLPDNITDDDLLGTYYPPENLSLTDGDGKLNVNRLNPYSLGQAPAGMGVMELAAWAACFLILNPVSNHKWFWADIVARFILEPYGLRSEGKDSWISTKFFSQSTEYAIENFPSGAPSTDQFFFIRTGRPFPILNNNIMEKYGSGVVQLPNQVTPVSGGAKGRTPHKTLIGGGSVESYGYASTLDQHSADTSPVQTTISQPYSLIDIVSTSSAFFAATIANWIAEQVSDPEKKKELIGRIEKRLKPEHKETLLAKAMDEFKERIDLKEIIEKYLDELIPDDVSHLIPAYNYWPIAEVSENSEKYFTDGGTLDNTGVIGLLAQTDTGSGDQDPIKIVVFDNTSTPLKKNGDIIAAGQAAPLFGIDFDTGKPFTASQKEPDNEAFEAASLIKVFNNDADSSGKTPFDNLVDGLYAASCGASSPEDIDDSKINREPAFYQLELTTVDNTLANITAGRTVRMLYIQNAKIMNWQNNIGDEKLKNEIAKGQKGSIDPFESFKDFPYYSTFFKIGLEAKESNALSQMWAWAVSDDSSPLKKQLRIFLETP